MRNQLIQTEDKLFLYMKRAGTGMAETDSTGFITYKNLLAQAILTPLLNTYTPGNNNLFDLLKAICSKEDDKLKILSGRNTTTTGPVSFFISQQNETRNEKCEISIHKIGIDCCVATFRNTGNGNNKNDNLLEQALLDKVLAQEKFQIAANVLHDIGNAVVGLSSYITRVKKSLEHDNSENLQNLADFFKSEKDAIAAAIGTAKADAIVKLVSGIAQNQKVCQEDLSNSNTELKKIIIHIQEVLNIQRQYMGGSDTIDKKQISLKGIVNDSISMLLASLKKREIGISLDISDELPLFNGDRTKLMQVILNILKNSVEAIDPYSINKSILISALTSGGLLILKIQDSGKGFDIEIGKKIFTRGFTTKKTGTGLGLEHCKTILEAHNASINIMSEGTGRGALTTIKFTL